MTNPATEVDRSRADVTRLDRVGHAVAVLVDVAGLVVLRASAGTQSRDQEVSW